MAKIGRSTQYGREEIELGSFQLTIGRRPDNNIVIDHASTAPQHAVVGFADGQYYIRDLKTPQGTRLNGLAVQDEAPLRHGDAILIGDQRLDFLDPPVQRSAPPLPRAAVTPPPAPSRASAAIQPPMMRPSGVQPPVMRPSGIQPPPSPVARPPAPPAPPMADATAPLMPEHPGRQPPPTLAAATPPPASPARNDPFAAPSVSNVQAMAAAARDLPMLAALPDAPTEAVQPRDKPAASLLDNLVGSIRSHREREQQEREDAQQRLRGEWQQVLASAEQLKQRVEGDPRVHYFAISRRNNDLIIRSQRGANHPVQFIQLSMEHPEDKGHALTGLWLRRSAQADRCYPTAREALSELVRELAFLLA